MEFELYSFGFAFQSFATLSDKLEPLVEGVLHNRKMWVSVASNEDVEEDNKEESESEMN